MAISEAQKRAVAKYNSKNYDRIELKVPKGKKDTIKAFADSKGKSINGFVNEAIDEKIERESTTE